MTAGKPQGYKSSKLATLIGHQRRNINTQPKVFRPKVRPFPRSIAGCFEPEIALKRSVP
jgi:hypothetical protein